MLVDSDQKIFARDQRQGRKEKEKRNQKTKLTQIEEMQQTLASLHHEITARNPQDGGGR